MYVRASEQASNELELVVYMCVCVRWDCVCDLSCLFRRCENAMHDPAYKYTYTKSYMHRYVWKYNKHTRRTKDKKQNKQKAIVAAA